VHESEALARISWGLIAKPGDPHAWMLIETLGPVEALRLVHTLRVGALAKYFQRVTPAEVPSEQHLASWKTGNLGSRVGTALRQQQRLGLSILSGEHPSWPRGLSDLGPYQPHSLWVAGQLPTHQSTLAVVGSRVASPWGLRSARAVVQEALLLGYGIVSGGARGIDQAAHQEALDAHDPQVAVLAGGLDVLYPAGNRNLFAQIRNNGALVSEAPCTVSSQPHRFLSRNRLIAALADTVIVVEAGLRSGAINTAGHASALGRSVGVVPGRWEDPASAGCWWIVRERAGIVLSEPADVGMLRGLMESRGGIDPGSGVHPLS